MHHLIVEYSRNLAGFPEAQVLAELTQAVSARPEIANEADLKARCAVANSNVIGTAQAPRAFVSARLRLLAGRMPAAMLDLLPHA
ncbi:MAG: hypothetical protein P4L96_01190 [Rhodoferax sp.]|uniref:hypothetical protein n=1 Tax=Cupriavidus basilensis TaxID=68895 RepID=UPI002844768F|nr:hypothetical protein [Cupriavidus basilensis]MDR3384603.1 hypothetical protein [Cupriavidus basilensis]MDR3451402.1 hypothetical protein [Rhodoferax sp.]